VQIFGPVSDDQEVALVMEYIDGCTLRSRLQSLAKEPLKTKLQIIVAAATALLHMHSSALLHGDFSANNLMVCRIGFIIPYTMSHIA
jgi:tRNA A-37 threonylcarbamoyl transferase component Bud32